MGLMEPIAIFVCYARDDGRWVDPRSPHKLIPWLEQSLRRSGVDFWVDRKIDGGDEWRREILAAIDRAAIAILLVDQPFLNSQFIEEVELPRIQARAERGELVVMPILTKPCLWAMNPLIESRNLLPMLPREVTPLIECIEKDAQWEHAKLQILKNLLAQVEKIRSRKPQLDRSPDGVPTASKAAVAQPADRVPGRPQGAVEQAAAQPAKPLPAISEPAPAQGFQAPARSQGAGAPPAKPAEVNRDLADGGHTPIAGASFVNSLGAKFVRIEPGTFMMGSPDNEEKHRENEKQHQVTLTKAFFMQTTPVTQAQWKAVMGTDPSYFKGDKLPVESVSWNEAVDFCRRLSKRENRRYRLPTEAEWEYACRAGTTTPFNTGPTISTEQTNYDGNYTYGKGAKGVYRRQTTEVGSFAPNMWGLYDMHGNVGEWC